MDDGATQREGRIGLLYGLAAFVSWGFVALYFEAVGHVAPLEVLAHRVVWSALLLVLLLARSGRLGMVRAALADARTRRALFASTTLILVNWYLFIWAVETHRLVEASLGYYINPLVNVLLGAVFLRERLSRVQRVAVALAGLGVVHHAVALGTVPVLGLALAVCFGVYGLVRKTVRADAAVGLTAETLLATPLAVAWLVGSAATGGLAFLHGDGKTDLLLLAAGLVTALPLLWFVHAARRLRYATVGFLQYLAPTLQFVVAVAHFGERVTTAHLVTFAVIWAALALYTFDTVRGARRAAAALSAAAPAASPAASPAGVPARAGWRS